MKELIAEEIFPFVFHGQIFEIARTDSNDLFVPAVFLFDALGLNKNTYRNRLVKHDTLKDQLAEIEFPMPYRGTVRLQKVICLKADYIQEWATTVETNEVTEDAQDYHQRLKEEISTLVAGYARGSTLPSDYIAEMDQYNPPEAQQLFSMLRQVAFFLKEHSEALGVQTTRIDEIEKDVAGLVGNMNELTGYETITPLQAQHVQELVSTVANALKKGNHQTVHGRLRKEFEVNSYLMLPRSEFPKVIAFLKSWYVAVAPKGRPLPSVFSRTDQETLFD